MQQQMGSLCKGHCCPYQISPENQDILDQQQQRTSSPLLGNGSTQTSIISGEQPQRKKNGGHFSPCKEKGKYYIKSPTKVISPSKRDAVRDSQHAQLQSRSQRTFLFSMRAKALFPTTNNWHRGPSTRNTAM